MIVSNRPPTRARRNKEEMGAAKSSHLNPARVARTAESNACSFELGKGVSITDNALVSMIHFDPKTGVADYTFTGARPNQYVPGCCAYNWLPTLGRVTNVGPGVAAKVKLANKDDLDKDDAAMQNITIQFLPEFYGESACLTTTCECLPYVSAEQYMIVSSKGRPTGNFHFKLEGVKGRPLYGVKYPIRDIGRGRYLGVETPTGGGPPFLKPSTEPSYWAFLPWIIGDNRTIDTQLKGYFNSKWDGSGGSDTDMTNFCTDPRFFNCTDCRNWFIERRPSGAADTALKTACQDPILKNKPACGCLTALANWDDIKAKKGVTGDVLPYCVDGRCMDSVNACALPTQTMVETGCKGAVLCVVSDINIVMNGLNMSPEDAKKLAVNIDQKCKSGAQAIDKRTATILGASAGVLAALSIAAIVAVAIKTRRPKQPQQ